MLFVFVYTLLPWDLRASSESARNAFVLLFPDHAALKAEGLAKLRQTLLILVVIPGTLSDGSDSDMRRYTKVFKVTPSVGPSS